VLQLSDLYAGEWIMSIQGKPYKMLALSLRTFALAEQYGCGLNDLLQKPPESKSGNDAENQNNQNDPTAGMLWLKLIKFLTQDQITELELAEWLLCEPQELSEFIKRVTDTFDSERPETQPDQPVHSHRRTRDPRARLAELEKLGLKNYLKPDQDDESPEAQAKKAAEAHANSSNSKSNSSMAELVIFLARTTGIPINDMLNMTFAGLIAVSRELQERPPTSGLGALAGLFGG
jgi:hypothetical protein